MFWVPNNVRLTVTKVKYNGIFGNCLIVVAASATPRQATTMTITWKKSLTISTGTKPERQQNIKTHFELIGSQGLSRGAYHLSDPHDLELSGRPDQTICKENFTINYNCPARSVYSYTVCITVWISNQNSQRKRISVSMPGRPVTFSLWTTERSESALGTSVRGASDWSQWRW